MVNVTRAHPPRNWNGHGLAEKEIYVLTADELTRVWARHQRKKRGLSDEQIAARFKELTDLAFDAVPTAAAPANDAVTIGRLAADLRRGGGLFTTYRVMNEGSRPRVAIRGNNRLRRHLRATVYGASHPQVLKFAIGPAGRRAMAGGGVIVTVVVSPAVRTLEWIFKSDVKWSHLLANVTTDVAKGVVAAGSYVVASGGTAAFVTALGFAVPVILPVGTGLAVAIVAGIGLNALDDHYEVTDALTSALEEARETTADFWQEVVSSIQDGVWEMKDRARSGAAGFRGAFY